jgi:hypothetical protein
MTSEVRLAVVTHSGVMNAMREESLIASTVERFEEVFNEDGHTPISNMLERAVGYLHKAITIQRTPHPEHEPIDQWLGLIGISSDFDVFTLTALYVAMRTTEGLAETLKGANTILIVPVIEQGQVAVAVMPCMTEEEYSHMLKFASDTVVGQHSDTVH